MLNKPSELLQQYQLPLAEREELLAHTFHERSKLSVLGREALGANITAFMISGAQELAHHAYKSYPHRAQFPLPKAALVDTSDLQSLIVGRRSARAFSESEPVNQQQLANMLQLSYGITGKSVAKGGTQYLRAVPSGGALYPLEIYVMARRVTGLEQGIYHYRVATHALEQVAAKDQGPFFDQAESAWGMASGVPVYVVITSVLERAFVKYKDRGYRFVLLEAGIVAQQFTLLAEAQGMRSSMFGGWVDDRVNEELELDPFSETSLLMLGLGKPT
jgi:SagB-type dehydrogenase family enzyme